MRKFEIVKEEFRHYSAVEMPMRSTKNSAGYDFRLPIDVEIEPNSTTKIIPLDVKAEMPTDEVLMLFIRSSLGMKKGLTLANTVGIIDADYYENPDNDGNIGIMLRNNTDKPIRLEKGTKVIQGIFVKYFKTEDDNQKTDRTGGFGSTGK